MKYTNKIFKILTLPLIVVNTIIGFDSCKKADTTAQSLPPGSYINSNVGSSWDYATTGTSNTNFTVTVEDSVFSFNAMNFRLFKTNTAGVVSRNYYNYRNGNYSVLVLDAVGVTQEIVYLKDSTQVGMKWSKSIKGAGGIMKDYNYQVIENIDKTLGGITYKQVAHIRLNIPSTGFTSDAYYAPKVGLILSDNIYASSNSNYHTELKSCALK